MFEAASAPETLCSALAISRSSVLRFCRLDLEPDDPGLGRDHFVLIRVYNHTFRLTRSGSMLQNLK